MVKLFIVGIPRDMQEIELVELFSVHGSVSIVTIITDIDSGQSKGYAFITMTDQDGANRAIAALDGASLGDRKINVRVADDKRALSEPVRQTNPRPSTPKTGYSKVERSADNGKKKRPRKPM